MKYLKSELTELFVYKNTFIYIDEFSKTLRRISRTNIDKNHTFTVGLVVICRTRLFLKTCDLFNMFCLRKYTFFKNILTGVKKKLFLSCLYFKVVVMGGEKNIQIPQSYEPLVESLNPLVKSLNRMNP